VLLSGVLCNQLIHQIGAEGRHARGSGGSSHASG
jgi:hypothetical protein